MHGQANIKSQKEIQIPQQKCFLIYAAYVSWGFNRSNVIVASRHVLQQQKQDRQCRNNVTLRRIRATTVTMDKQQVLHILSVCL